MRSTSTVLALALVVGCGTAKTEPSPRGSGSPATSSLATSSSSAAASPRVELAASPVMSEATVRVQVDGKPVAIKKARLRVDGNGQLQITLAADEAMACNKEPVGDSLRFAVAPGPSSDFYAGRVIPTELHGSFGGRDVSIHQRSAQVRLDRMDPGKGTTRVAISVTFEGKDYQVDPIAVSGGGSMEVEVCGPDDVRKALAASPPREPGDGPVRGEVGGKAFEAKSALLFAYRDAKRGDYIDDIRFFPGAASCSDYAKSMVEGGGTKGLAVKVMPGHRKGAWPRGVATPATYSIQVREGTSVSERSGAPGPVAIVRIDSEGLDGPSVRGSVVLDAPSLSPENVVKLDGRFDATICWMQPLP